MGFAAAPATRNALAAHGIRVAGYQWRWALGLKRGTYPPHLDINYEVHPGRYDFDSQPGEDLNGESCMCAIVPQYKTPDGRFAKPGLTPIFQPPVTASQAVEVYRPEPLDLSPLAELLATPQPINVTVTIPDGAIVINVPLPELPKYPVQPAPVVNVAAPSVNVAGPTVNVAPPSVTVAAPKVTVSPNIDVKPAPVKIIREKILGRKVRFMRGGDGKIDTAEVTE